MYIKHVKDKFFVPKLYLSVAKDVKIIYKFIFTPPQSKLYHEALFVQHKEAKATSK